MEVHRLVGCCFVECASILQSVPVFWGVCVEVHGGTGLVVGRMSLYSRVSDVAWRSGRNAGVLSKGVLRGVTEVTE